MEGQKVLEISNFLYYIVGVVKREIPGFDFFVIERENNKRYLVSDKLRREYVVKEELWKGMVERMIDYEEMTENKAMIELSKMIIRGYKFELNIRYWRFKRRQRGETVSLNGRGKR